MVVKEISNKKWENFSMLVKLTEICKGWQNFEDGNKWYQELNLVRNDVMMLCGNNDMMNWI